MNRINASCTRKRGNLPTHDAQVPSYVAWSYSHTTRGLGGRRATHNPPPDAGVRRGLHAGEREPEEGLPDGERRLHVCGERDGGLRGDDPEHLLALRSRAG